MPFTLFYKAKRRLRTCVPDFYNVLQGEPPGALIGVGRIWRWVVVVFKAAHSRVRPAHSRGSLTRAQSTHACEAAASHSSGLAAARHGCRHATDCGAAAPRHNGVLTRLRGLRLPRTVRALKGHVPTQLRCVAERSKLRLLRECKPCFAGLARAASFASRELAWG